MSNNSDQSGRTPRIGRYQRCHNGLLLTAKELANQLGEKPRTIISWRQRGIIPFIDAGYRSKRYKLPDVLMALERRTIKPRL
jgi:hypothetical protein